MDGLQLRIGGVKLLVCLAALPANLRFVQLAVHGWKQPVHFVFEKKVMSPPSHNAHRDLFSHGTRDDDEWNIQLCLSKYGQGGGRAELRKPIVGDDQVPGAALEGGSHLFFGFDPFGFDLVARPLEKTQNDRRVILRVFDLQEA